MNTFPAAAQSLSLDLGGDSGSSTGRIFELGAIMTVLSVVPGLTCFWQVNGRSEIPFEQQVEMDLDYIQQRSLWTDIKVLFKTIPAVLFGRGAY